MLAINNSLTGAHYIYLNNFDDAFVWILPWINFHEHTVHLK